MDLQAALQRLVHAGLACCLAFGLGPAAGAATCTLGILADLPVTMEGSRASVPVIVNGKETAFWLDSGSFLSIMSAEKAAELGLSAESLPNGLAIGKYDRVAAAISGIGGTASVKLTTIKSFVVAGRELKDVKFLVGASDVGSGLIGRNTLAVRDTEFDLADGTVRLIAPHDCEHVPMAYWAKDQSYFTVPLTFHVNLRNDIHAFQMPVTIDGAKIQAIFDTGAEVSLISRRAAERAGIDLHGPDVVPTSGLHGFGRRFVKGWVVPVANVSIGDEQILNSRLDVIDENFDPGDEGPDMLLGADFMMAHHIYVARDQGRIYMTYNGGKPFRTSVETSHPDMPATATPAAPPRLPPGTRLAEAVSGTASEPTTADGFARRGDARLSARNYADAIADLTAAIKLAPGHAGYFADRSRADLESGDPAAAHADFDKALALDPGNGDLLRTRARQRLIAKDRAGALADTEAAAKVTPPASLASAELANLFTRLGQPLRAIGMLDTVIAAHDDDAQLTMLLNFRCQARGLANVDLSKAIRDCDRAMRLSNGAAAVLESRALIRLRQANYPQAISDSSAAIKLNPRLAWSLYLRGVAEIALGQADAGKADQAAARAVQPDIADDVARYGIGSVSKTTQG